MPINTDPHFVGRAWIAPEGPVVVGQLGTWTPTYEVGAYGYDELARLKIAARFTSDWEEGWNDQDGAGVLARLRVRASARARPQRRPGR